VFQSEIRVADGPPLPASLIERRQPQGLRSTGWAPTRPFTDAFELPLSQRLSVSQAELSSRLGQRLTTRSCARAAIRKPNFRSTRISGPVPDH